MVKGVGIFNLWSGEIGGEKIDVIFVGFGIDIVEVEIFCDCEDGCYFLDYFLVCVLVKIVVVL